MSSDPCVLEPLPQSRKSGLTDGCGRAELPGDRHRNPAIEHVVEALGVSWHNKMEMFVNLVSQRHRLIDQVAAMSRQQLEVDVDEIGVVLQQAEAVDGGAVNGGEIGVVGFVAGVRRLSELLGGKGVDQADLKAGLSEGAGRGGDSVRFARRRRSRP